MLEIELNRPQKFNSLDTEMLTLISEALDLHVGPRGKQPSCSGIILTSVEGRAFSAGGDIKHVVSLAPPAQVNLRRVHCKPYYQNNRSHFAKKGRIPAPGVLGAPAAARGVVGQGPPRCCGRRWDRHGGWSWPLDGVKHQVALAAILCALGVDGVIQSFGPCEQGSHGQDSLRHARSLHRPRA